ncbi:MAG: hypothetical protein H6659_14790 [Ardenticatenaceae bacterium]|nr:hypothetical protein [Ardenticatenaceae bacterium]MCB8986736.1 hypothetical protein [Ardenticatenaceae bacterium]
MKTKEQLAELFALLIVLIGYCKATEWAHTFFGSSRKVDSVKYLVSTGSLDMAAALHLHNAFSGLTAVDVNDLLSLAGWD